MTSQQHGNNYSHYHQLPPGRQDPLTRQGQPSDREWKKEWITGFKNEHPYCFQWLVGVFRIPNYLNAQQQKLDALIDFIEKPDTLLQTFRDIHEDVLKLKNQVKKLEDDNIRLRNSTYSYGRNQSELQKENQRLKNDVNRLEQENRRQVAEFQATIEELKRHNQELGSQRSSLLGRLSDRDRDKSSTVTSDDSRRQRDTLTQTFIQLNNQEFNAVSIQVFNYFCEREPSLKSDRKQEIARIKSILSEGIFKVGNELFQESITSDKIVEFRGDLTNWLLQKLQIPSHSSPEELLKSLENLVEKGLNLVKDIVNDDPPGQFLIEEKGTFFNPENHQVVPGCQESGRILYTIYPGYLLNDRILADTLKAFVFTVPEENFEREEATSNPEQEGNSSENDAANTSTNTNDSGGNEKQDTPSSKTARQMLEDLQMKGLSDQNVAQRVGVTDQTVHNWRFDKQNPKGENLEKLKELYKENYPDN